MIRLEEVNDRHIVIDLDFESTASAPHTCARRLRRRRPLHARRPGPEVETWRHGR